MNIQIFGKKKCFDTKKAERWFKERRIKFQQIDLVRFGMSGGEFDSVLRAMGGVDALIDWSVKSPEIDLLRYTDDRRAKEDKLFDHPELMKTPIVRNGRQATAGYHPEFWEPWEERQRRGALRSAGFIPPLPDLFAGAGAQQDSRFPDGKPAAGSYAGCGLTAQPARYAFICSLAASAKVLMPAAGQCAQRSSRSGREPAWR